MNDTLKRLVKNPHYTLSDKQLNELNKYINEVKSSLIQ